GGSMVMLNSISRVPSTRKITARRIGYSLKECQSDLEEPFHVADMSAVDDKEDHMVVGLDPQVVVGNQHFATADNGTDGGAFGQVDFVEAAANDLGRALVAMGNGFDGFGGAPAQGMHVDNIAPAHVGQQAANRGLLGRDGDVDLASLDQVHIVGVVDQRHDLAHAQPLGQHGGHDVGFVIVGDGTEDIGIFDILFQQQVLIRPVALQHNGAVEGFRQFHAAVMVTLDQLDVVTAFQLLRQMKANIAAAGDQDALVRLFPRLQFAHHVADMLAGGNEKDLVAFFNDGISLGNDGAVLAVDGRNPGIHMGQVLAQIGQLVSDQRAPRHGFDAHQPH